MRTLVTVLLTAVVLLPLTASATIINIPGDYPTIQEGINHGSDGDTVLVQPDIYYENINFNGHNVVLASLFLTTGDTIYVLTTLIDGDRAGSVITFESGEDSTTQMIGFTIRNGYGHGGYPYFSGGGITCWDHSRPMITNNIICNNRAFWCGGGISCCYSSPTIALNTIRGNEGIDAGGGIFCICSHPTITENRVDGNWGYDGGAIYCYEQSNPTISKNSIMRNSSASNGGGIFCADSSNPVIESNIITENYGGTFPGVGGGIFLDRSQPTIRNNVISRNVALYGGGLACTWSSNPQVLNNMAYGNVAVGPAPYYGYGGGLFCVEGSYPVITNSVFWADTAETEGNEFYVDLSSFPIVTYCDIEDTLWPGVGNISADPVFCGQHNEDFYLRWHSPCIDAGDPEPQYNDPDGTRNDMGCFYFNQDVDGIVELYPHDSQIVIPPEGGDIIYDGWVFNFFGHAGRVDIWTYAFVPEMGQYGPLALYENVRIPADSLGRNGITEHVPGAAPEGDYVFVAYVGEYPSTIIDSSCLYFTKTGSIAGGIADWQTLKGWFDGGLASTGSDLPTHYALSQNYPNPFNASTVINYQLPITTRVKLEVYNLLGQRVASLMDEKQQAGYRSVVWDASEVSSGVYFYKLSAGDYTQSRRMMLVK